MDTNLQEADTAFNRILDTGLPHHNDHLTIGNSTIQQRMYA